MGVEYSPTWTQIQARKCCVFRGLAREALPVYTWRMLTRIPPSRCTGTFREEYLDHPDWIAEPKLDGSRYMLYLDEDGTVHLYSRRDFPRIDKAANLPHIAKPYPGLEGCVLDGEVMHPNPTKLGDTTGIMNSLPAKAIARQDVEGKLHYNVFDILYYHGVDVRQKPLRERRQLLEMVVDIMHNLHVSPVPQHFDKDGLFRSILAAGGEGTVLKNRNSPYGVNWVKNKRVADFSVIISGYKPGQGKYAGSLGAVAVSVYKDGQLVEVGFASGMTDAEREDIWTRRDEYLGAVIDISAQEVTKDGRMRHPRWLRFRDDVAPETLTFEKLLDDAKNARRASKE
jgi:bifunctional non-homologous end joining protein LigD